MGSDLADVGEPAGAREVPSEDGPPVLVELDLPDGLETGALEPEVEPADPREEGAKPHRPYAGRLSRTRSYVASKMSGLHG